jgi:hypothetical protein
MAAFQPLSICLPYAENEAVSWACAAFAIHGGFRADRPEPGLLRIPLSHEFGALELIRPGGLP